MSCLTKGLLFFMVLSIVCNQTFSRRNLECEANVHLVFRPGLEMYEAFNFSLFALSLNVIDAMTTTEALSTSILDQFETFKHIFGEDDLRFLRVVGNYIGTRNVEITKSAQKDIKGYFYRLTRYFYTIYDQLKNRVKPPAQFCAEEYKYDVEACRMALKHMLQKTDNEFNQMLTENAFEHCYLNYRYLDFFDDSIFSEMGSSSTTTSHNQQQPQNSPLARVVDFIGNTAFASLFRVFSELGISSTTTSHDQQQPQNIRFVIAKNYYSLLMAEMYDIVKRKFEQRDYEFFLTVQEHCERSRLY